MTGSWRWNFGFAGFGAILTFLFSLSNNPILTTLIRSGYAFVAFGLLAIGVRFVLGQLLKPARSASQVVPLPVDERGGVLDVSTPSDEESLTDLMKEQWAEGGGQAEGFQPLNPPKLVSLDNPEPEQVVQAVRRLTDE